MENVDVVKKAVEGGDIVWNNRQLIWNMIRGLNGGAHVIDVSNAFRTMLINPKTLDPRHSC